MAWSGYISDLGPVGGFELGWAEVSQAAVQAGAVVLGDGAPGAGLGGAGLQGDPLPFDGAEEALGEGVVPALAGAAVRQLHLPPGGEGGERGGCALAAPVAVEDHS